MGAVADIAEGVFESVDNIVQQVASPDNIGKMIQMGATAGIAGPLAGALGSLGVAEPTWSAWDLTAAPDPTNYQMYASLGDGDMGYTLNQPAYNQAVQDWTYTVDTVGPVDQAAVNVENIPNIPGDMGQVTDSFGGGNYAPPVTDYSGGFPNYDPSAAIGGATAAQAGGMTSSSLLGPVNDALAALNKNLGTNITLKDIGTAGANWLVQNQLADRLEGVANKASSLSNPLDAPQRQPYQGMLSQLLTNPQQFYSTNPVVQGQLGLAKQQFEANSAKMGTGGTQFNDYLKNVQNIASGTFNDQASLLAGLGGFNQGPGYAGVTYGQNAGAAATARTQGLYGLGQMTARNPFESPMQGQTGTSNVPGGGRIA